ncbi:MAG: chemoreceptor glutamine deamidase CheD [Mariprofundaceae bacterium]|nr:chemoreceptor glutamine deamidase CheD [Mariprofundaceae bacterium]
MKRPAMPPTIPGFEHISRHWYGAHDVFCAKVQPGDYYITDQNEAIYTVLGSCISACIRDVELGLGGINHFMLPIHHKDKQAWQSAPVSSAERYGNYAMEHLINDIIKHGGSKRNLEIKIFGGGRMLAKMGDVGADNIRFVREYLKEENLKVVGHHVGGNAPRKIYYFPQTGRVLMKTLKSMHVNKICEREANYLHTIDSKPVSGEVDLF